MPTADYQLTFGSNLPKGPKAWNRCGNNHEGMCPPAFDRNGNIMLAWYNGENFRGTCVITPGGEWVNDFNQPASFRGWCSQVVLASGMRWGFTQDHILRGQMDNDYGHYGEEVGNFGTSKAVNHHHAAVNGLTHSNGTPVTFENCFQKSNIMGDFPIEDVEPGRFELKRTSIWGWVRRGQDMDLAGRGNTLVMSYRGYYFDDVSAGIAPTYRSVNYIKFLDPATGQTLGGTTSRIEMAGTFGGLTLSGPVTGIAVDTNGDAIVCVGNNIVRVTAAGVRTLIASGLPEPWRIACDTTHLFVYCEGDSRVHKLLKATGATVSVFGRSGGRAYGPYVPTDYKLVSGIREDNQGGYWIAEHGAPRRVTHFDGNGQIIPVTINGQLWEEFYGGGIWVPPMTVNPQNLLEVLFGYDSGTLAFLRINWHSKTFRIKAIMPSVHVRQYYGGGINELTWVNQNGQDWLIRNSANQGEVWRLDRQAMLLRPASIIKWSLGRVETATNAEGTTWSIVTNAGNAIENLIHAQPAENSLNYFLLNNTGPEKELVPTFNSAGNPVYNLGAMVNRWEWDSLPANSDFTTGQANPADPSSIGFYKFATGQVMISRATDTFFQMHSIQTGLQAGQPDPWNLTKENRIFRWSISARQFKGVGGTTSAAVKNATNAAQTRLTSWSQVPPPGEYHTFRAFNYAPVRGKYWIGNSAQGGWYDNNIQLGPCLKVMVDADGVFYESPYHTRITGADKRAKHDWYYHEGSENGVCRAFDCNLTGDVLIFAVNDGEGVIQHIYGPEFEKIPTITIPADDLFNAPVVQPPLVRHAFLSPQAGGGVLRGLRRGGKRVRILR